MLAYDGPPEVTMEMARAVALTALHHHAILGEGGRSARADPLTDARERILREADQGTGHG